MHEAVKRILGRWEAVCLLSGVILLATAPLFNGGGDGSPLSGVLFLLGLLAALAAVSALLFRLARLAAGRVFHTVRNRIIATYILAGVLPLFLALILFLVLFDLFMVQLAGSQFRQSIEREFLLLAREAQRTSFLLAGADGDLAPDARVLPDGMYEGCRLAVRTGPEGHLRSITTGGIPSFPEADSIMSFFAVIDDSVFMAVSVPSEGGSHGMPCVLAVPVGGRLLEKLERELGGNLSFIHGFDAIQEQEPRETGALSFQVSSGSRDPVGIQFSQHPDLQLRIDEWKASQPGGPDRLFSFWLGTGFIQDPEGGPGEVLVIGLLGTTYSHVAGRILQGALPENVPMRKVFLWVAVVLAALFVGVELVALAISLMLSRSITRAIARLHRKAELVARGDLTYRIDSCGKDQLGLLAASFDTMSDSLRQLLEQVREKERLEHELAIAQEVQRIFFPAGFPGVSGFSLHGSCKPAQMVSGDYYDCVRHPEGVIDFFIGDISGKGISAALLMAGSQTYIRSEAARRPMQPVTEIVRNFNEYLVEHSGAGAFTSLFYGRIDPEGMTLTFCNAGHPAPFLFRGGMVTGLSTGGLIPGVMPGVGYDQETVGLLNGDLIVAFTDGFTEVFDADEREFGEERLSMTVMEGMEGSLEAICEQMVRTVREWSGGGVQSDDMTAFMVRVH